MPTPNDEDFIKVGFIVTCLYMWIFQSLYCASIGLTNVAIICGFSFVSQLIILSLFNLQKISSKLTFHFTIIVTLLCLNLCYLNAGAYINPTIIWLTGVPILSVTLLGVKIGGLWALISSILSIGIMETYHQNGWTYNEWNEWHIFNVGQSNLFTGPLLFFAMFSFYFYNRKKLQEKISEQARIIQAEKMDKEKLLSVLFHELGRNTSLLSGYLELSENKSLDKESQVKISRLTKEIKKILQNAKSLDCQELVSRKEIIKASNLFHNLSDQFEILLKEKNLTFTFRGEDIDLFIDIQHLKQHILGNLLSNAIKFSHPEGEILFNVSKIGQDISIQIIDHGIGVNNFEVKMGTIGEKGNGLGLKIASDFSKKNNLTLNIYTKGKTTIAELLIPEEQRN